MLKGGDELFFVKPVMDFYNNVISDWDFDSKSIALLLGCTMHKPYSQSFMHRKVIGMLQKHGLSESIQQYIIGEPLAICPREWEEIYPAAHYDFPPERMSSKGRNIFTKRLRKFFKVAKNHYSTFVVFTPNHHREIILEASRNIFEPTIVSYNIYQLPNLLKALKQTKY